MINSAMDSERPYDEKKNSKNPSSDFLEKKEDVPRMDDEHH
jgi:hypothetical protein